MSAEFARLLIAELRSQIAVLREENYSSRYTVIAALSIQIVAIENVMHKMGHKL